jgi:hypothetical protein
MVDKHLNNSIAPVRSRGGSLVHNIDKHHASHNQSWISKRQSQNFIEQMPSGIFQSIYTHFTGQIITGVLMVIKMCCQLR